MVLYVMIKSKTEFLWIPKETAVTVLDADGLFAARHSCCMAHFIKTIMMQCNLSVGFV